MSGGKAHSALMNAFEKAQKMIVVPAKVTAVNEDNFTCDVDPSDGGASFFDVRLRAAIEEGDHGVVIIPKVGSQVLIGMISNSDRSAFVCGFSKVSKVIAIAEDDFKISGKLVEINGQDFTMLKGAETLAQVQRINDRLESLITVIKGSPIPEPGSGSPSALQTALASSILGKLKADLKELENNKVKHGQGN